MDIKKDPREPLQIQVSLKQKDGKSEIYLTILISDIAGFKTRSITRDEKQHFIMIGSILQEDIKIINMFTANHRASQYLKQTEIKGETGESAIILAYDIILS